jgi:hypothetical protein
MTIPLTEIEREMDVALTDGVTLAGRRFRAASTTTFEHDCFNTKQMRECGLLSVAQKFDPMKDEIGDVAGAIIIEAYASGKLFNLLAGVLVEKLALRNFIPWALLNFFLNADASWRTFLKYSSVGNRASGAASLSPSVPSEDSGTMESGTTL